MSMRLEAVAFNHDPTSAAGDAVNLRRDEVRTIPVPEWRRRVARDLTGSAAAYAAGALREPVTIAVTLSRQSAQLRRAEVRAIAAAVSDPPSWWLVGILGAHWPSWRIFAPWLADLWRRTNTPGNVLGDVAARTVDFGPGAGRVTTAFELERHRLLTSGVGAHLVRWRWQWRPTPLDDWQELEGTAHRVYTLLEIPTEPWEQEPYASGNMQLPWSEVLEHACRWAAAARDPDQAAAAVSAAVYGLGGEVIAYDCPGNGFTRYTDFGFGDAFDCSAFLERLAGGFGRGYWVNCVDCATIVSTFANAVGCDLWQSAMFGAVPFALNPSIAIGYDPALWRTPCGWPTFGYHETAWKGDCTANDAVFDACVQVDGWGDPTREPRAPLLPANLRFGRSGEGTYLDRLVAPQGRRFCTPQPDLTRRRRPVGRRVFPPVLARAGRPVDALRDRFGFEDWQGRRRSDEHLFVWRFLVTGEELSLWRPFRVEQAVIGPGTPEQETNGVLGMVRTFWRPTTGGEGTIELAVYECVSRERAHALLLELLGRIQAPVVRTDEELDLGDVAFAGSGDSAAFFARANLIAVMRSAGRQTVRAHELAREFDHSVIRRPRVERPPGPDIGPLSAPQSTIAVGTAIALDDDVVAVAPEPPTAAALKAPMVKLFARSGDVVLEGGTPSYRASSTADDEVDIYAVKEDGVTIMRRRRIAVRRRDR